MKNEKTIKKSRLLSVCGGDFEAVAHIVTDVLTLCGFKSCMGSDSENGADFVILPYDSVFRPDASSVFVREAAHEAVLLCGDCESFDTELVRKFRIKVIPFERKKDFEAVSGLKTYSRESDGADIVAKNVKETDEALTFELLGTGVIGRVRLFRRGITVKTALEASAMLISMGIPLAAVLNGINETA